MGAESSAQSAEKQQEFFAVTRVRDGHPRASVREPLDPLFRIDLLGLGDVHGELHLSARGVTDLIVRLTKALDERFQRWDVRNALGRTEPLGVEGD